MPEPVDPGVPGETPAKQAPPAGTRRPRRARLAAAAGTDPEPYDPPIEPRGSDENDERLQADRPPHWG